VCSSGEQRHRATDGCRRFNGNARLERCLSWTMLGALAVHDTAVSDDVPNCCHPNASADGYDEVSCVASLHCVRIIDLTCDFVVLIPID
jgi:hypothetical protein